jgi:hypothetical protein
LGSPRSLGFILIGGTAQQCIEVSYGFGLRPGRRVRCVVVETHKICRPDKSHTTCTRLE